MISKRFAYCKPSELGMERMTKLRHAYTVLESVIEECCLSGREKAEALTCLETSAMFANKAVNVDDPKAVIQTTLEEADKEFSSK